MKLTRFVTIATIALILITPTITGLTLNYSMNQTTNEIIQTQLGSISTASIALILTGIIIFGTLFIWAPENYGIKMLSSLLGLGLISFGFWYMGSQFEGIGIWGAAALPIVAYTIFIVNMILFVYFFAKLAQYRAKSKDTESERDYDDY